MAFQKEEIRRLLERLNDELAGAGITGELYLVGGAVMCLAFNARPSTRDLDGFFKPARAVRSAAKRIAATLGLDENWLNDAVKGYLGNQGDFQEYLDLSNLRVMIAGPEYLLAMKCLALRLGEEFHDEADVRFLLRYLNITNYRKALDIICQYYPLERFPQKTLYALEEMVDDLVPD
ncbi:MAG: hypothetical protein OXN26_11495 [Gammaproteobacteria bacterium]|nr:hypothetical protein [Gammaproteobacteria bacterium]